MKNRAKRKKALEPQKFLEWIGGGDGGLDRGLPGNCSSASDYAIEAERGQGIAASSEIAFRSAKPIWPQGREKEMNLWVGFRAVFDAPAGKHVYLRMTGCTFYHVYLNGEFHGWGPARAPQDYFRVDFWDITPMLVKGRNFVCVEVAGYNVNSLLCHERAIFPPGGSDDGIRGAGFHRRSGQQFEAKILPQHIEKVQRYTFQRTFSEGLSPGGAIERLARAAPTLPLNGGVCGFHRNVN